MHYGCRQTAAKTALISQPHGGALRRGGKPGNRGGTGRPPDEFKRQLVALVDREETVRLLRECLDGTHGPAVFLRALEFCLDRAYGKVPAAVTGEARRPLTIRIVREGHEGP